MGAPEILCTQGRIETGNGSAQTLYLPKKLLPKMKKKMTAASYISQVKTEITFVLFERISYTAKKKRVFKSVKNKINQ